MRRMLFAGLVGVAATALLVTAGAFATNAVATNATPASSKRAKDVQISTRKLPKLGAVLVNNKGLTLYMFVPDKQKRVTCKAVCAAVWPPLKLPKGAKLVARGGAKVRLAGSDANPAGGRVVTYNGWPLYTYIGDKKPGEAKGQALNLNGGLWYVLSPSGKVIRTKL